MAGYGLTGPNDFTSIAISKLDPRTPYGATTGFLKVRLCEAPGGRRWAIVNCQDRLGFIDPKLVEFLTSSLKRQAATSHGVTWTWIQRDLAADLQARGYRMSDTPLRMSDFPAAMRSWHARKLVVADLDLGNLGTATRSL